MIKGLPSPFRLSQYSVSGVLALLIQLGAEPQLAIGLNRTGGVQRITDSHEASKSVSGGQALYAEGLLHLRQKQYELAVAALTRALGEGFNEPKVFVARAEAYYKLKKYAEALKDISEALEVAPNHAYGYTLRAAILDKMNRTGEAIRDLTEAIRLSPQTGILYRMRGSGYLAIGESEKALEDLSRAILLGEATAPVYHNRALAFKRLERYEDARRDLSISIDLGPSNYDAFLLRGWINLCVGEIEKGIKDLDTVLIKRPGDLDARLSRAWGNIQTNNLKAALADLNYVAQQHAQNSELYLNLATIYYLAGDFEKAYAANQQALKLNDEHMQPEALFQNGLILLTIGQEHEAKKSYEEGLHLAEGTSNLAAIDGAITALRDAVDSHNSIRVFAENLMEEFTLVRARISPNSKPARRVCYVPGLQM